MKWHKIRNVPIDVCSAEQKVAYNMAFRVHINQGDQYRALQTTAEKEYAIPRLISDIMDPFRYSYN